MRTLLSTRLFCAKPLTFEGLQLARRIGFTDLELYSDGKTFDVLDAAQVRRAAELLGRTGLRAPWLHLSPAILARLVDDATLGLFTDVVRAARFEVVTVNAANWAVRPDQTFLSLDDLKFRMQSNGARLVLDLGRFDDRITRSLPPDLGLCWDLAVPLADEGDVKREVGEMLGGFSRGRLAAVRVAHPGDGRRDVPTTREATMLEEVWRLQAPGTLVYDVDDPAGYGYDVDLRETLEQLRDFHAGSKRPHTEDGGGLFWAALAPG